MARIELPPRSGKIVATEWDLAGTGEFTAFDLRRPARTVVVRTTFTYTTPGTYYAAVRVTSQREGDPGTPFARVQNLGRVRVVVH